MKPREIRRRQLCPIHATLLLLAVFTAALVSTPTWAQAESRAAGCGMGYMVFMEQKGLLPQVLAVFTNHAFYPNQMLGITSGTLGCKTDGVVQNEQQRHHYVQANRDPLLQDMARRQGVYLDTLAHSMGVARQHRAAFRAYTQQQVATLAATADADTFLARLDEGLRGQPLLARYAAAPREAR